jgi:hypothetical protein
VDRVSLAEFVPARISARRAIAQEAREARLLRVARRLSSL